MRRLSLFALLLCLIAPLPAAAQTAEERTRLEWALQRGRLLFAIDRAAWVSTDDLRERLPQTVLATIRGWTVERDSHAYTATYYAGEGETRVAVYRARVENNRLVSREVFAEGARPPLTPLQRRLADSRQVPEGVALRGCARSGINIAVIPPEGPDAPMDVYFLTPQIQTGLYPTGGHNRVTLNASGEVLSHRAFTNTCLSLSDSPEGASRRPEALMVTHLLDPIPTEIHVFLAIWIGLPLYVGAGDRVWEVTGDAIRFVDDIDARSGT